MEKGRRKMRKSGKTNEKMKEENALMRNARGKGTEKAEWIKCLIWRVSVMQRIHGQ